MWVQCYEGVMLRLMDQEWNLSIPMKDRYTLGPLGDITLVSLQASDLITKMLYHGNKKRVLISNEVELGMQRYRRSDLG